MHQGGGKKPPTNQKTPPKTHNPKKSQNTKIGSKLS